MTSATMRSTNLITNNELTNHGILYRISGELLLLYPLNAEKRNPSIIRNTANFIILFTYLLTLNAVGRYTGSTILILKKSHPK